MPRLVHWRSTRNVQIASLWEQLNTHQPWRNVLDSPSRVSFDAGGDGDEPAAGGGARKLAFIGINTVRE